MQNYLQASPQYRGVKGWRLKTFKCILINALASSSGPDTSGLNNVITLILFGLISRRVTRRGRKVHQQLAACQVQISLSCSFSVPPLPNPDTFQSIPAKHQKALLPSGLLWRTDTQCFPGEGYIPSENTTLSSVFPPEMALQTPRTEEISC